MFTPPAIPRRSKLFCAVMLASIACSSATAAIRQFPIPTIEKLGRELYVQTQRPQNLTEPQQRAMRAAMGALPKLQNQAYRFAVLSDPERKGYLVYALATGRNPKDIVVGLHYRVSVSADGRVQRVDPLAGSSLVIRPVPSNYQQIGFYCCAWSVTSL